MDTIDKSTARLITEEENEFIAHNQFYLAFIFSSLWLLYCWWLSEWYHFDFGRHTTLIRLLFCVIHVLTVWNFFQYITKLAYCFNRRVRATLSDHLFTIGFSFVLFVLLTFIFNLKNFLQEAFAIVD